MPVHFFHFEQDARTILNHAALEHCGVNRQQFLA
jgi:hypothetical protein